MRDYYMSTLTDFYQTYLTLVRLTFLVITLFLANIHLAHSWRQDHTSWMRQ